MYIVVLDEKGFYRLLKLNESNNSYDTVVDMVEALNFDYNKEQAKEHFKSKHNIEIK